MNKKLVTIICVIILLFSTLACSDHTGKTPEEACRIENCRGN